MKDFERLLVIAQRKSKFDQNNPWYQGPESYLTGLFKELEEVLEEIPKHRKCYLEDELGDVLWNYLNSVIALAPDTGISIQSVLSRACNKFEARVSGIESGQRWSDIKAVQKEALRKEQQAVTDDLNSGVIPE